jgi:hypothetical protein
MREEKYLLAALLPLDLRTAVQLPIDFAGYLRLPKDIASRRLLPTDLARTLLLEERWLGREGERREEGAANGCRAHQLHGASIGRE